MTNVASALLQLQSGAWLARVSVLLLVCLGGCAGNSTGTSTANPFAGCRAGDTPVSSEAACLQDDATCYQLNDNSWCTGPRAATCPAGSIALANGAACPANTRCFAVSDSLSCSVAY